MTSRAAATAVIAPTNGTVQHSEAGSSSNPPSSAGGAGVSNVKPLPPSPPTATLKDVLPFLCTLALSERQLYWRMGLALVCMVASKVSGLAGEAGVTLHDA